VIEIEVRDRVGFGGIEGGRLIEIKEGIGGGSRVPGRGKRAGVRGGGV